VSKAPQNEEHRQAVESSSFPVLGVESRSFSDLLTGSKAFPRPFRDQYFQFAKYRMPTSTSLKLRDLALEETSPSFDRAA
jgi:hypothetical protein